MEAPKNEHGPEQRVAVVGDLCKGQPKPRLDITEEMIYMMRIDALPVTKRDANVFVARFAASGVWAKSNMCLDIRKFVMQEKLHNQLRGRELNPGLPRDRRK